MVLFTLAAQNSGCNRKHSIEARCARWLLMVADRLDIGVMELTHDFVAQMLGVRRASVTETLGELERHGLIQTSRGRIRIIEREGLQKTACECYGVIRGVVHRLLETGDGTFTLSPKMQAWRRATRATEASATVHRPNRSYWAHNGRARKTIQ